MRPQPILSPQEYLARFNSERVKVHELGVGGYLYAVDWFPRLGELEKVVVGYVASSTLVRPDTRERYERTAYQPDLRELIFTYLKNNYPSVIKRFLRETRDYIQRAADSANSRRHRHLQDDIDEAEQHIQQLLRRPLKQIDYWDFNSPALTNLGKKKNLQPPNHNYVNNLVYNLVTLGVLEKHKELGTHYVSLGPGVRVRVPKRREKRKRN